MQSDTVYIGIDSTAGGRLHSLAVLDFRLHIVRIEKLKFDPLIEAIDSYESAVCGVDAPISAGKGLMADKDYRKRMGIDGSSSTYTNYRVAEYELRRRRIGLYNTPKDPDDAPTWMKEGWRIYDALRKKSYVEYPRTGPRRVFETFPHGGFMTIIKRKPYSKSAVEGLLQRQMILFEEGVVVPDPMETLEEWTRHKVLAGELTRRGLYDHDELDALMAAYTAYLADRQPNEVCSVGDPLEGQIILPVPSLLEKY